MTLTNKARRRIVTAVTSEVYGEEIVNAIDGAAFVDMTSIVHEPAISPAHASSLPGTQPIDVAYGTVMGLIYSPNDASFRMYKIPYKYAGTPSLHVHWTKSGNVSEAGKNVRWRLSYIVVNGENQQINLTPTVLDLDDTYIATDTTDRVIYETSAGSAIGFISSNYLFLKVESVTPDGTPLANNPVLISVDLEYSMYINK